MPFPLMPIRRFARTHAHSPGGRPGSLRLRRSALLVMHACWALAAGSSAASGEEEDLAHAYGGAQLVSIATGSSLPVSRAPAVATVITAQDIAAIGATDLDDVLETVPGLHVARSTQLFAPVYVMRGINLGFNPQVLMLINGIPVTTVFTGNRGAGWGGMPLEHVARIEVIRGPGSAVYGADAISGVINIITKTAADIQGTQAGVRVGSFDSQDAWLQHGGQWAGLDVAGYLRIGRTDGHGRTVSADAQTGFDGLMGTSASHAPAPIDNWRRFVDGNIDLSRGSWRWRAGYKQRDLGAGTGIASALDPTGESFSRNFTTDLTYDNPDLATNWSTTVQASYMHYVELSDATLYPPGAFGGAFVDGMIGNPDKWERHGRLHASAFYSGWSQHRVRLGMGYEQEEVYQTRESKNFNPDFSPIGTGSVADVVDVSDTAPFMRPHSREKYFAFVQDEWSLVRDWTLTAGLRHDHYADFGGTTNPRLALVWDAAYNVTAKLMYGTAFRAPSMSELYAINNPVVMGNANLAPETIETFEAAVSWQPNSRVQLGLNVFHYEMDDIIRLVNGTYRNAGGQHGSGLEFEAGWDASRVLRLTGNYSYQYSIDETTGRDAGNAPHHQLYARADWRVASGWILDGQVNWIGERNRVAGDVRAPLDGYATFDLTLRTDRDYSGWNFAASVRNMFDADAREPSPNEGQGFVNLPDDYPLAGRAFYVQATYRF